MVFLEEHSPDRESYQGKNNIYIYLGIIILMALHKEDYGSCLTLGLSLIINDEEKRYEIKVGEITRVLDMYDDYKTRHFIFPSSIH